MKHCAQSSSGRTNRIRRLYGGGLLLLLVSAALGILLGNTALTLPELGEAFSSGFRTAAGRIFLYVRLPRTAASLVCGGALAVSGAVIQGVLANRLASPGIIGVNAGAGLAVTLCAAAGVFGGWQTPFFAFFGAFAAVMLVSLGSRKWSASRGTVILIGVAVNSLLGAASDMIITLNPDAGVMSNDFRVGDFSAVTGAKLLPAALLILAGIAALLTLTNELDVLTLGEDAARGLGMNTALMRVIFLLLAALLAGCAVSAAGLLSFVGLIVPHAVRRLGGNRSCHLLGLCALYGAGFVCLCDTAARTVFSPYELPVGIIMAFLGAPFFLFILVKGKGGHGRD